MKNTTSPAGYHIAIGLALLASTVPRDYGIWYASKVVHPTIYSILVGRSGDDQKSTALGIGKRLLGKVDKDLIGDQPGSAEGLLESLSQQEKQTISYSEFGVFLSQAKKGYFEPIKDVLTDLWDCEPAQRRKVKGTIVRVENPRLTLMGGCALPLLEAHTNSTDWTGGFLGRWFIIYSTRERTNPFPEADMTAEPWIIEQLSIRAESAKNENFTQCSGLSEEAKILWQNWFLEMDSRPMAETISGVKTRVPEMALRIALLYAWDFGYPLRGEEWELDYVCLYYGIRAAELHISSVLGLSTKLADHQDARERRQFLDCIKPGGTKLSSVVKTLKFKRKKVMEILDSLLLEQTIERQVLQKGDMLLTIPEQENPVEVGED